MTMTAVELIETTARGFLNLGIITSQILFLVSFGIGMVCLCTVIAVKVRSLYNFERYRVTPIRDEGKMTLLNRFISYNRC